MNAFAPIGGTRVRAVRAWDAVPYPDEPPSAPAPPPPRPPRGHAKLWLHAAAIRAAWQQGTRCYLLAKRYDVHWHTMQAFLRATGEADA